MLFLCFFSKPFEILKLLFTELESSPSLVLSVKLIKLLSMPSSSKSLAKWRHNHICFFPLHFSLCLCLERRCSFRKQQFIFFLFDLPLLSCKHDLNVSPNLSSSSPVFKCLSITPSHFSHSLRVPLGLDSPCTLLAALLSLPSWTVLVCPSSARA